MSDPRLVHVPIALALVLAGCGNKDVPKQCLDDEFEPNHSLQDAHPLTFTDGQFSATDVYLCEGDQDWYAIDAVPGQAILFQIDFTQADGDLDLEMYTSSYGLVASSVSTADSEYVRYVVPVAGTYYMHVFGKQQSSTNVYSITASLDGVECHADAFEPNDSPVQPANLPTGVTPDLTLCAYGEDWYKIHAEQGQVINVQADFDPSLYDLSLTLYTAQPLQEVASSDSSNDIEQIVRRISDSGDYLLQVRNKPEVPHAEYALNLQMSGEACVADSTEPNDSYFNATQVPGDETFTDLELCYGDQDWYQFNVSNGQAINLRLSFDSASYDLGINLYELNPDGTLVYRSGSDNLSGDEVVSFRPWEDGTFLAYLYGSRGTVFGKYDFDVNIEGDACVRDDNEPNDSYLNATPVSSGQYDGETLCVGDTDWYQFDVGAGQLIDFALDYDFTKADLGVSLYELSADGTLIGRAGYDSIGDAEEFVYRPYQAATFVTQVYRSRGTNVASYSFKLDVTGQACTGDSFEPNNIYQDAVNLPLGVPNNGTLCVGDVDYYKVTAQAGQVITLNLNFDQTKDDLGIQLYQLNSDGTLVSRAGSDSVGDDEVVQYQPYTSGTFIAYVYRSRGTELAAYTLTGAVAGDPCADDAFEPNNLPQYPVTLAPGVRNGLTLCVGDADYYKIHAGNGQIIDVLADIDPTKTDVALNVYKLNSDGTYIGRAGVDSVNSDEHLIYRPFETGDFLLGVTRSRGATTGVYNLTYQLVGAECHDDAAEPNNNAFEATPITAGSYAGRTLCTSDADYYVLDLVNGQTLSVDVLFSQAQADLGVALYRMFPDGTLASRAGSDDTTDNESFVYTPYEDGKFVLYVYRSRGTEIATYDMNIGIGGSQCAPDPEEPNNALYEAKKLTLTGQPDDLSGGVTAHTMCTSDADYYELQNIGLNQLITVDTTFINTESDLAVTLYKKNADGTFSGRASSNTLTDRELFSYRPFDSGTFVIGVTRAQVGTSMSPKYNMAVTVTGPAMYPDAYEPNEHWLSAKPFPTNGTRITNLTSPVSDVDWYDLGAQATGKVITITEDFVPTEADMWLGLYVLNADNTVSNVAAVDGVGTTGEIINYTVPSTYNGRKFLVYTYKARDPQVAFYNMKVSIP